MDIHKISDWFFYTLLIAIVSVFLYLNYISTKQRDQIKTNCEQKLAETKKNLKKLRTNFLISHLAEDFANKILDSANIEDINGQRVFFKNLFQKQKHLVLLFRESICPICIELEIQRLLKTGKTKKIILLTSKANKRFVKILRTQYYFNYNILFWSKSHSNTSKIESSKPLYFISDGITNSHFFIIDKSEPELTDNYLKYISKHL